VKWRFAFKGASGFGAFASTPISVGGTVYLQDLNSNVYALDRTTGKVRQADRTDRTGQDGQARRHLPQEGSLYVHLHRAWPRGRWHAGRVHRPLTRAGDLSAPRAVRENRCARSVYNP
jgi:hypothetical protein